MDPGPEDVVLYVVDYVVNYVGIDIGICVVISATSTSDKEVLGGSGMR